MRFLPEFRAKNQSALERSPSIRIPPLSSILGPDDEDLCLCPVRALRRYLSVISRPANCRKLFISCNPQYDKDVSVASTSRWISQVVRMAYTKLGSELGAARAHELRAWSASLAHAKSLPLREIMESAYWKSESSFTDFYLRDVSLQRQDGTRAISTVVAAQRVLNTTHL